jgi:hypothetical protein
MSVVQMPGVNGSGRPSFAQAKSLDGNEQNTAGPKSL